MPVVTNYDDFEKAYERQRCTSPKRKPRTPSPTKKFRVLPSDVPTSEPNEFKVSSWGSATKEKRIVREEMVKSGVYESDNQVGTLQGINTIPPTIPVKSFCPTLYPTEKDRVAFPTRTDNEWMTHLLVVNGIKRNKQKKLMCMMRKNLKEKGDNNIGQAWISVPESLIAELKEEQYLFQQSQKTSRK